MTEIANVSAKQFVLLVFGAILMIAGPIVIAVIWTKKKKERFTTILVGAATFLLFAIILEKPVQALLIAPTQMGLPDTGISQFINARPVLLALLMGIFPGVFEETGRLLAFKTLLRKRKNRETSISYGIGHGGFEVIIFLGITYISNISIAVMINSGAFGTVLELVRSQAPEQADSLVTLGSAIASFSFADLALGTIERISGVLFHIGASIIVFYACRDKGRIWLYPIAILLHTAMDFVAGMTATGVLTLPVWAIEVILAAFGVSSFLGAYLLLYKRDRDGKTAEELILDNTTKR